MPKFKAEKKARIFYARETISSWSQSAKSDSLFLILVLVWFIPSVLTLIYTALNFNLLPNQIPLFYSRAWGQAQLAAKHYIFLLSGGTFLLGLFNFGLAVGFHAKDRVLSYLLSAAAALASLLAAITTVNIIILIK